MATHTDRQRALERAHRQGVRVERLRGSDDTYSASSVSRPGEFYLLRVVDGEAQHIGTACEGYDRGHYCVHQARVEEAAGLVEREQQVLPAAFVLNVPDEGIVEIPLEPAVDPREMAPLQTAGPRGRKSLFGGV